MRMPVVQVRIVRMAMNEPFVMMRVRVGLAGRIIRRMLVLVMFIVYVSMFVRHFPVCVFVVMKLDEV